MTPPTWSDVAADLATALTAARRAEAKAGALPSVEGEARENAELAIGKHIHDAYSAAEAALERVVIAVDGEAPQGRSYHRDLVDRASRPFGGRRGPLIREETRHLLIKLVAFRHAYRHVYEDFEWDLAAPNVAVAAAAIPMLAADLEAFRSAPPPP